ncbi:patatin-like phospholipase family protein [Butyrivibrio sp. AE2032]|uniref:patatin-like phospholipase family protein n=1 Tax=Butyrivibrio sp. AE2032 TaxID=1458463 RepID=UPI0005573F01|nr:patatin family protein [Butyrivibrio sp. AE2032]
MSHGRKVYSRLNEIPTGHAKGQLTNGCLVVEGGAFRGLYNQGVMDFFMENNLNFECVIGVSAGAMAALNYASGQIGRSARCNLTYRHDSEYIGAQAIIQAHSPLNIDFALRPDEKLGLGTLDENTFYDPQRRFIAVATDCDTGKPVYFEKGKCKDILKAIKASASMPYVSPMVEVDEKRCLDGGCSCHIPYRWALEQGYENIVVIKTRERGFRKKESSKSYAERFYKDFPEFAGKLMSMNADYNKECDEIDRLEEEGRIFVIAPSEHVTVKRVESNMNKLGNLYWLGYNDAKNNLFSLNKYLK